MEKQYTVRVSRGATAQWLKATKQPDGSISIDVVNKQIEASKFDRKQAFSLMDQARKMGYRSVFAELVDKPRLQLV